MNKLPLKYQGVTQGEWKVTSKVDIDGPNGESLGLCLWNGCRDERPNFQGPFVPLSVSQANATLMADSKRLAGAVVELRNALEGYAHCGDGCTCGDGWSHEGAKIALEMTKEWA